MTKSAPRKYNGLLAVNKPKGMISKDVSRLLMKHLGKVKLGHVGTLDPAASGVLPLLFGSATKIQDYLLDSTKGYELDIEFGYATDSLDLDGEIVEKKSFNHVTKEQILKALEGFVGEITQIPPIFSAVKYKGRPLYDYARSGRADEVPLDDLKRQIKIYSIELVHCELPKLTLRVECSKGTYVRVLARDLSLKLNTCGTMTRLIRTKTSGVSIESTREIEEIEASIENFDSLLIPIEKLDLGLPVWLPNNEKWVKNLENGQILKLKSSEFELLLEKNKSSYRPEEKENVIFLIDCDGKAFGIGLVTKSPNENIILTMKRGLR